jgi:hypothetical protein
VLERRQPIVLVRWEFCCCLTRLGRLINLCIDPLRAAFISRNNLAARWVFALTTGRARRGLPCLPTLPLCGFCAAIGAASAAVLSTGGNRVTSDWPDELDCMCFSKTTRKWPLVDARDASRENDAEPRGAARLRQCGRQRTGRA